MIVVCFRNDLENRKSCIINAYDCEMMEKYKNVNEFNSKIKTIEDSIYQLQVIIPI